MSSHVSADVFQHSSCCHVPHAVPSALCLTLAMAGCLTQELKTLQKAPVQTQVPPPPPRVLLVLLSVTGANLGTLASQKHFSLF